MKKKKHGPQNEICVRQSKKKIMKLKLEVYLFQSVLITSLSDLNSFTIFFQEKVLEIGWN